MRKLLAETAERPSPFDSGSSDFRIDDCILSDAEISRRTSLSRTTIWRLRRLGRFPAKVPISAGRGGSSEREIQEWIEARLAGRDWEES